jgi:AmmeMemoRadiSam system protein A
MPSAEPRVPALPTSLRAVAREAIELGLETGCAPVLDAERFEPELRVPGASFVTLRRRAELRGCTGSLEARIALVEDVARNAWRSASADPRFPPLAPAELEDLEISVSVLSPLQPFHVESELDLLARLRPGVDGLVLREGARSATFLPSVWESLPEPRAFLDALRHKAGLPSGHWSGALRFERYTTRDAP